MRSLKQLDEEWANDPLKPDNKAWVEDLKWHLENDEDPDEAISMATDAQLRELAPYIAKHLYFKEYDYTRELAAGCLGRLYAMDYVKDVFDVALNDTHDGPRALATMNLGCLMEGADKKLKKEIATYLIKEFEKKDNSLGNYSRESYFSIYEAMGNVSAAPGGPPVVGFDYDKHVDPKMVEAFRKKFGV